MDTQEEANQYRKEVVKFNQCPTILTRTGERIRSEIRSFQIFGELGCLRSFFSLLHVLKFFRSNGKFGGSQNRAPPAEKMRNMFGEPKPTDVEETQNLVDLLKAYKSALVAHQKTAADIEQTIQQDKQPDIREKKDQLKQYESELAKVDKELGLTNDSLNHSQRGGAGAEEPSTPSSIVNTSRRTASNTSISSTGRRSATPSLHDTPPVKKSRR